MEFVKIAKIINTFGLKGELKLESYTDFEKERFVKDSIVYLGDNYLPMVVLKHRNYKGMLLVTFKDHEDINLVEKYKGLFVYKNKADIKPLKKGEYFFSDLKGLDVYIKDKKIGKVLNVEEGVRNNYLRVRLDKDTKEKLVPFLDNFIVEVNLNDNKIEVVDMEGLL